MISFQTNYASLVAADNLSTNQIFQTKTVQALTSGYRINQSGDDAAGLAVANQYRSNIAELTQGVLNANNGVNTLQIVDGGLSNISAMLDRMKTLATESASGTFQGSRGTLDQEYQNLKTEITRQATNIGLVAGGSNASKLSVYVGGAPTGASLNSAAVSIDLSTGLVDAGSLGLAKTSVDAGTVGTLLAASSPDVSGGSSITLATNVTLTVSTPSTPQATPKTVTLSGTATGSAFVSDINSQLAGTGVTADINSNGQIEFKGGSFSISATDGDAVNHADVKKLFGGTAAGVVNSAMYGTAANDSVAFTAANTAAQTLHFTVNGTTTAVQIAAGLNEDQAVAAINNALNSVGISAVAKSATSIQFQGSSQFSWEVDAATSGTGPFATTATTAATAGANVSTTPPTLNATDAIASINSALSILGSVQGTVGAGENQLQYAINLATSQITNMSSAQSSIRDADVAKEAANLTKAQVLAQASVAAMAQANAAPQAILKLLQ